MKPLIFTTPQHLLLSEDTRNPKDFYVSGTRMLMYAKKITHTGENLRYRWTKILALIG